MIATRKRSRRRKSSILLDLRTGFWVGRRVTRLYRRQRRRAGARRVHMPFAPGFAIDNRSVMQ